MGGFIALYVTACLNLASPGSCATELVTELDAESNDDDRVPWCRGPELSQRVRGEAPALSRLAVQRLELPDRQQARPEEGAGMSRSGRCEPTVSVHSNEDGDDNRLGEFI